MAKTLNITRAQAGIRLALADYPEGRGVLFAFGNAPTALLELCSLIHKGKCHPEGIVGAPVGFVHVEESKHAAKPFADIPKILVEGRKGGSNLAATLVNSILTYDDAEQLRPGRRVGIPSGNPSAMLPPSGKFPPTALFPLYDNGITQ